jgi:hypothetical protein
MKTAESRIKDTSSTGSFDYAKEMRRMKIAKVVPALLLALFLMCLFCSCESIHEAALRAGEKPPADTPYAGKLDAVYDYGFMALDDDEMAAIFELFGFEDCILGEFGILESITIDFEPNECFASLIFNMDKPYEEVKATLMDHMEGDWETDGGEAYVYIFGDDFSILCSLFKDDEEIWLHYMADFEVPFIKTALDDHWPPVLEIPEELSGQPDWSLFTLTPEEGFATYMREWELKDDKEAGRVFEWLGDSLEGNDIHYSDITDRRKSMLYNIQGVNVWITCEKDTLSISCDTA